MATTDEAELDNLARAAQRGDQRAFGELVERLMNPVMALTYRLTGDRDTASDLAQETFVTAWKEMAQYRGQGPIKNWVWRIASNRSLNYLESRSRRQKLEAVAAPEDVSTQLAPDRNYEQSVLERGVLKFMATLPPQQRLAFDLRFYQQLSFEEMSQIMGRALGTVKTLYREAVGKLRIHAQQAGWRS